MTPICRSVEVIRGEFSRSNRFSKTGPLILSLELLTYHAPIVLASSCSQATLSRLRWPRKMLSGGFPDGLARRG